VYVFESNSPFTLDVSQQVRSAIRKARYIT
jgi:hypothetical protein